MRPQSIIIFERLFLAGVVLSIINFAMAYSTLSAGTLAGQNISQVSLIAGFCIGIAIYLLLWFMIVRKTSSIARWALVVVIIVGLVGVPAMITPPLDLGKLLGLAVTGLHLVAIIFLFRRDTSAWMAGETRIVPLK